MDFIARGQVDHRTNAGMPSAPPAEVRVRVGYDEAGPAHLPAPARHRPARVPAPVFAESAGGPWMRALDIVAAAGLLLFLLPVLVLISVVVFVTDPGPVVFAHRRIGRGGRTFPCYKFRSMVVDAERRLEALLAKDPALRAEWQRDHKLRNDPRITGIGRFLRNTSLDELPQLVNVLRGEMSLVGPRPIVAAETSKYGRYIDCYYSVRPGLTGLWQVSGRSDTSYRRRVAMDVVYARSKSPLLDLHILLATVPAVLAGRGSC